MSFFGKPLQNPLLRIRKELIPSTPSSRNKTTSSTKPTPSTTSSKKTLSRPTPKNTSSSKSHSKETLHPSVPAQKRKRSNLSQRQSSTLFADSSSEEEDDAFDISKRSRSASTIPKGTDIEDFVDLKRILRPREEDENAEGISVIHAADVASLDLSDKFEPALKAKRSDDLKVRLYYPGAPQPERYQLVYQKDKLDSVQEILNIVETLPSIYLSPSQSPPFTDSNDGLIRKLQRAKNLNSLSDFKSAIQAYNTLIKSHRKSGVFSANLDSRHTLPKAFVQLVLDQIYDRAVSPDVDTLTKYKNGTDNVYGELKPGFISRIFAETALKSDQIFLDLGSGCGNVVLQAALQVGCESWGCEMMPNACILASKQHGEFTARCRLWGISPGIVHLESGDFLENEATKHILKKADVILVNNQAFTPKLNDKLKMFFLDLKPGCRVVSLKAFGRVEGAGDGGGSGGRNENDLGNIFGESRRRHFYANDVSWTDSGIGDYFIATRREDS